MRNWIKLFTTYNKMYDKKLATSKVGMEARYNLDEFKAMYTGLENDRKREIRKGTRKVANVTKDLVARQENYLYTMKQAKTLKKAMQEQFNENYKLKDIRSGAIRTEAFWQHVKEVKKLLEVNNPLLTKGEVNEYISETFFGS